MSTEEGRGVQITFMHTRNKPRPRGPKKKLPGRTKNESNYWPTLFGRLKNNQSWIEIPLFEKKN